MDIIGIMKRNSFDELSYLPFWSELTESEQRGIQAAAMLHSYEAGEVIDLLDAGQKGLWIVAKGCAIVRMHMEDGRQIELIRLYVGAAYINPLLSYIDDEDCYIEITAAKGTSIIWISECGYLGKRGSEMIVPVCRFMGAMVNNMTLWLLELVKQLAFYDLKERLRYRLEMYSLKQENRTIIVTHEELANELGTSREVISRTLMKLSKEGVLTLNRKRITLLR